MTRREHVFTKDLLLVLIALLVVAAVADIAWVTRRFAVKNPLA
jgi:hypothetical protein